MISVIARHEAISLNLLISLITTNNKQIASLHFMRLAMTFKADNLIPIARLLLVAMLNIKSH